MNLWEQFFHFIFSVLTNFMMQGLKRILVVLVLIQCTVVESDVTALANRFDCKFPLSNIGNSGGVFAIKDIIKHYKLSVICTRCNRRILSDFKPAAGAMFSPI